MLRMNVFVNILLCATICATVLTREDDYSRSESREEKQQPKESYSTDMYVAGDKGEDEDTLKKITQPVYEEEVKPLLNKMKLFKRKLHHFMEEMRSKKRYDRRDGDWRDSEGSSRRRYHRHRYNQYSEPREEEEEDMERYRPISHHEAYKDEDEDDDSSSRHVKRIRGDEDHYKSRGYDYGHENRKRFHQIEDESQSRKYSGGDEEEEDEEQSTENQKDKSKNNFDETEWKSDRAGKRVNQEEKYGKWSSNSEGDSGDDTSSGAQTFEYSYDKPNYSEKEEEGTAVVRYGEETYSPEKSHQKNGKMHEYEKLDQKDYKEGNGVVNSNGEEPNRANDRLEKENNPYEGVRESSNSQKTERLQPVSEEIQSANIIPL